MKSDIVRDDGAGDGCCTVDGGGGVRVVDRLAGVGGEEGGSGDEALGGDEGGVCGGGRVPVDGFTQRSVIAGVAGV